MKDASLLYVVVLLLVMCLVQLAISLLPSRHKESLLVLSLHGACLGILISAFLITVKALVGGAA